MPDNPIVRWSGILISSSLPILIQYEILRGFRDFAVIHAQIQYYSWFPRIDSEREFFLSWRGWNNIWECRCYIYISKFAWAYGRVGVISWTSACYFMNHECLFSSFNFGTITWKEFLDKLSYREENEVELIGFTWNESSKLHI